MADIDVDHEKIKDLSVKIDGLNAKFDPIITKLDGVAVVPGDFPAADDLKTIVHTRRDEVVDNMKQMKQTYLGISDGLETVSNIYKDTNDDNSKDAEVIGTLVSSTDKSIPGFDEYEPQDQPKGGS
jgi:hypothetical protein